MCSHYFLKFSAKSFPTFSVQDTAKTMSASSKNEALPNIEVITSTLSLRQGGVVQFFLNICCHDAVLQKRRITFVPWVYYLKTLKCLFMCVCLSVCLCCSVSPSLCFSSSPHCSLLQLQCPHAIYSSTLKHNSRSGSEIENNRFETCG